MPCKLVSNRCICCIWGTHFWYQYPDFCVTWRTKSTNETSVYRSTIGNRVLFHTFKEDEELGESVSAGFFRQSSSDLQCACSGCLSSHQGLQNGQPTDFGGDRSNRTHRYRTASCQLPPCTPALSSMYMSHRHKGWGQVCLSVLTLPVEPSTLNSSLSSVPCRRLSIMKNLARVG